MKKRGKLPRTKYDHHNGTLGCCIQKQNNVESEVTMSAENVKIALGCLAAAFLLYINTIYADFAYDDSRAILKNQDLREETPISNIWFDDFWGTPLQHSGSHKSYRPLVVLTFRLNYALHQLNPGGYHFVNMISHVVTTVIYTIFVSMVSRRTFITLVSSLLFAIHPIHTEAVAGVVGRADVLCGLFFILSLISYIKYCNLRNGNNKARYGWLLLTTILASASTLSKEIGITVFGVCAVYDVFCHSKLRLKEWKKEKVLSMLEGVVVLTLSAFTILLLRLYFMGYSPPSFSPADNPAADNDSVLTRTLTFLYLPVFNFILLVFPVTLSFDWSMDAIPLVDSLCDSRVGLTILFYSGLVWILLDAGKTFISSEDEKQSKTQMHLKPNGVHHHIHDNVAETISSKQSLYTTSRDTVIYRKMRRDSCSSAESINSDENHNYTDQTCIKRSPRHHAVVLFSLALMILSFLPASNLFFYVGFVVAERVLYVPSMGFCLLVGEICYTIYKQVKYNISQRTCFLMVLIFCGALLSARTYVRCLDWRSEESLYKSGIGVNPAKAWGNLANILNNQGNSIEAESAYRKALTYRGNMADVHYNLGILLQNQKRYVEALDEYKLAIECRPRLTVAHLNKGIVLALLGRNQQAVKAYKECSEIDISGLKDPRMHESAKISALYNLGRLYAEHGDFKSAISTYNIALSRRPSHYSPQSIYNLLGEAYYQSGNFNKAESAYRKSLEAKRDHVPAHLTLARLMSKQSRHDEAENWYLKAIELDIGDSNSHQHYAIFLSERGRHADSLTQWLRAEAKNPNDFDTVFNTASTFRQLGKNDEAEKYYLKASLLSPKSATAHMNLGAMYHINKKYSLAERSYLKALEITPKDSVAQNNLKKLRNLMNRQKTTG